MPTYLVHGFRWARPLIRIHIIKQDLEDAASEWIMAPATSVALLNSFYTQYDFLPPSSPPPATYPIAALQPESPVQEEPVQSPRLTKKNTSSRQSLRASFSFRKNCPAAVNTRPTTAPLTRQPSTSNGLNGIHGNGTTRTDSPPSRPSHSTTSNSNSNLSTSSAPKKPTKKDPHFNTWSVIKLLEQYNLDDLNPPDSPYAYVADYILRVDLGISIADEINKYEAIQRAEEASVNNPASPPGEGGLSAREIRRKSRRLGWFEKFRDELQKGADIGWYVVVCGDEERDTGMPSAEFIEGSISEDSAEEEVSRTPRSAGLRGFFGRKKSVSAVAE
ncbi:hypothetical protein BJ875DRAFT_111613 [Amylocarpus encephaloides]|uniref:Developmental regulator protein n=1 Tax=Amylocarpus encephaloides TaxID=45428 RepID=A0A9P7YDS5_9HELO|nr:hypothetical protein BJ875DRAFT_111613 [Amylocarpus encephaloides]